MNTTLRFVIVFAVLLVSACGMMDPRNKGKGFNILPLSADKNFGKQADLQISSDPKNYPLLDPNRYADVYAYVNKVRDNIFASGKVDYRNEFEWKIKIIHDDKTLNASFWKEWIALIFVPLGFVVLFKAKPKDFWWILIGCWISYFSFKIGNQFTSNTTAVFLASLLLGIGSNLFSLKTKRNPSVMLVPGMILLVPGSLGFLSISKLVESDVVGGIQIALNMLTTSMALVLGIIFSNVLLKIKN